MKAVWRSDTGLVRGSNQDALLALPGAYPLYAVADGMGGHLGGDTASAMAIEGLRRRLPGHRPDRERLISCVTDISREIYDRQLGDETLQGMGTTLTLLWRDGERLLIGHVGDSRAYLFRDGALRQVSQDHSLVGELLRSGVLDEDKARSYPYRNVITRAVGTQPQVSCDVREEAACPGDRWLLCTDGLSEHLSDGDIEACLRQQALDSAADQLLSGALSAGGRDNITLILLEVACG